MFERFVVATDLSSDSERVVGCLAGLKDFGARHALLLQCLEIQEAASVALSSTTSLLDGCLEQQKAVLEKQGFEVETRIVPGFARSEINRIAREEDYSLIVVGSHIHPILMEPIKDRIAGRLLHGAERPVLIIHLIRDESGNERCALSADGDLAGHILYATDFSDCADQAFTLLERMAETAKRITLLHVLEVKGELAEELAAIDRDRLEAMKARLIACGEAEVSVEIRRGRPDQSIIAAAQEYAAHLIVMGTHGRSFVSELFLGSISHQIARYAPIPVLLVPAVR